jgi:hypothetical protein
VSRYTIGADTVTGEPSEQLVVLLNLGKVRPPATLSAAVTYRALLAGEGGADDVAAVVVTPEADTLAAAPLRAGASADLVYLGGLGARRDKPLSAALVASEDLVAVKLEETGAAQDVGWLWFGGGLVRWLR